MFALALSRSFYFFVCPIRQPWDQLHRRQEDNWEQEEVHCPRVGSEAVEMKGNERRVKVLPGFIIVIIIIIIINATTSAKLFSEVSAQCHQTTRRQTSEYDRKNLQSHISEKRRELSLVIKMSKTPSLHPGSLPRGLFLGVVSKFRFCDFRLEDGW